MPVQAMLCPRCGQTASEYDQNKWQCLTCGSKFIYEPAAHVKVEKTVSVEENYLYTCRSCKRRFSRLSSPPQLCKKCGASSDICPICYDDRSRKWRHQRLCEACSEFKTPPLVWGFFAFLCLIFLASPIWFLALPVLCLSIVGLGNSIAASRSKRRVPNQMPGTPDTAKANVKGCFIVLGVVFAVVAFGAVVGVLQEHKAHIAFTESHDRAQSYYASGDFANATAEAEKTITIQNISDADKEAGTKLWLEYKAVRDRVDAERKVLEAQELLKNEDYEKAVEVLMSMRVLPGPPNNAFVQDTLSRYGDAVLEKTIRDFIYKLPEKDFAAFVSEGVIPEEPRFDDPEAEKAFRKTLATYREKASELRAQEVAAVERRKEAVEKQKQASERQKEKSKDTTKRQDTTNVASGPFIYARRVDNIRTGPGTNFAVLRQTSEDEQLRYSERKGDWYKLITDSKKDAWVHESVVLTAEEKALWNLAELELQDWSWSSSYGFVKAAGRVKNVSGKRLENVTVVVTFESEKGEFISKTDGLVDFNPLLPDQTSTFEAIGTYNPEMKRAYIAFAFLWGRQIPCRKK